MKRASARLGSLAWAAVNLGLVILSGIYAFLGFVSPEGDDCYGEINCGEGWPLWSTIDAVAALVAATTLVIWLSLGMRRPALLAVGSAALLVPLYRIVGLDYF
jgi:hypothetical protein